jgi:hypothetical protein
MERIMRQLVKSEKLNSASLMGDDSTYEVNGVSTHNCCFHPDEYMDIELEEDIVEYEDKFYTMKQAKRKGIIHKKGEKISLPIKYNFKYKVFGKDSYETPIERQELPFTGNLLHIKLKDGNGFRVTPDHRCFVVNQGETLAKDLKIGMLFLSHSKEVEIVDIVPVEYHGMVYCFTMPSDFLTIDKILSKQCRLRLDLRQIRKQVTGGLFGSGDNTGCYDDETEVLTKKVGNFLET